VKVTREITISLSIKGYFSFTVTNFFLGAFVKLRKATTNTLILSLRPSVCPYATTRLPLNGFSWNLILSVFRKSVQRIQVSLKSDKNNGHFTWRPIYTYFLSYLAHFLLEWEMFQTKVVEKIKTHMLCSFFSPENRASYEKMWKNKA
jgi:hypothetical protein